MSLAPRIPRALWRHEFSRERGIDGPITEIPLEPTLDWARDLDAIVIGGGGLLSSSPGFEAFLLHGRPLEGIRAAWNALGSLREPWYVPELGVTYRAMRACAEQLAYVSVRDKVSRKFLQQIGVERAIEVVPDPVFLLEIEPRARAVVRGENQIDEDAFVIGLSVGSSILDVRARPFYSMLFASLAELERSSSKRTVIVIFPFGNIYEDPKHQELVQRALPRARSVVPATAIDLWRLIGSLDVYIGTRFHAILAAYAQDVPFVILDEYLNDTVASSKLRELAVDDDLEWLYLSPWISMNPIEKLRPVIERARGKQIDLSTRRRHHREQLLGHYRAMLAALGVPLEPSRGTVE